MQFEIGSKVRRAKERQWEIGEVVEIDGVRVRVRWPGNPEEDQGFNYNRPKRTWIKSTSLVVSA
jgi:hypothetical protein